MAAENQPEAEKAQVEGLRERKRKATRQRISDVATRMFLERGFNEVRVAEIAAACDVSEKTVYNYFPTKESLMLDREDDLAQQLTEALGPGSELSPIDGWMTILDRELDSRFVHIANDPDSLRLFQRFRGVVNETPALLAFLRQVEERLTLLVTSLLAERAGMSVDDPEPRIAAHALSGLWDVHWHSINIHIVTTTDIGELRELVSDDVRRAARLLDSGLWSFGAVAQHRDSRADIEAAQTAAQSASKKVLTSLRKARQS